MLNSLYSWRPRIVFSYHFDSYLNLLTLLNVLAAMLGLYSEVDSPWVNLYLFCTQFNDKHDGGLKGALSVQPRPVTIVDRGGRLSSPSPPPAP